MTKIDIINKIESMRKKSALFLTQEEWYNHFTTSPRQIIYYLSNFTKKRKKFQNREYATKLDKHKGLVVIIRWH